MDPSCSLAQPSLPPPPLGLHPIAPAPSRRPTGFASLLNPSPPVTSPPSPKVQPLPAQLEQQSSTSADPWTSFFPQLPQTRRKRAPAATRTRSDPNIKRAASESARTPSPYPHNQPDLSAGPYTQPPTYQSLPAPGSVWGRDPTSHGSVEEGPALTALISDAPQAIGWAGVDEGRKRKRRSAEREDGAPGVPIVDPSLPGGDAASQGLTFYRQVAPRRAVGDEPIMYVSGGPPDHHYPPPPARQHWPSDGGHQPGAVARGSASGPAYNSRRPSPPEGPYPNDRTRPREDSLSAPTSGSRPSVSPERYHAASSAGSRPELPPPTGGRENALRMNGMQPFESDHHRRLSAFQPQARVDDETLTAARRSSYATDPLGIPPPSSWPAHMVNPHHAHSTSSRSDSSASLVFDEASTRSSFSSSSQDATPFSPAPVPADPRPPPPGSPPSSGRGLASPHLGPLPRSIQNGSNHHQFHRHSLHDPASLSAYPAPLVATRPERESKRRRAGSLSTDSFPVAAMASSQPQEPRRSSTPVNSKGSSDDRRPASEYERYHDATPRAGDHAPRQPPPQLPIDLSPLSSTMLPDPSSLSRPALFGHGSFRFPAPTLEPSTPPQAQHKISFERGGAQAEGKTPVGSTSCMGGAHFILSDDDAAHEKKSSPTKRTLRPAPFSGANRNFTFGSPTKPKVIRLSSERTLAPPPPLPTMWLAPSPAGGDGPAHDGQAGRHLRLPSLTEALRDLEVREPGREP